jgi:AraC-like DNA-binding protein
MVPVRELIGKRGHVLEQSLHDAGSVQERMRLIESWLTPVHALSAVQNGIAHLAANGGSVRLDEIARMAGLSSRHFRRRCLEETGLTPKQLARIGRFRRTCLHVAQSDRLQWADLACECGYYDQAHLINEFRQFSGVTPDAYWRETRA